MTCDVIVIFSDVVALVCIRLNCQVDNRNLVSLWHDHLEHDIMRTTGILLLTCIDFNLTMEQELHPL